MIRILLLLGCLLSIAAQAAEPLPFPQQLAEFQHRALVNYEPQSAGLGYSHNYGGPNANASVYLYTRSAAVPDSVDDPFFAQELANARSDLERFAAQEGYQQLQVARYGEFINLRGYRCLSMLASYIEREAPRITMTCVMPFRQQILKVRYTFLPVINSDDQGPRLAGFLDALAAFLQQQEAAAVPARGDGQI